MTKDIVRRAQIISFFQELPLELSITADPGAHFVLALSYFPDDTLFRAEFNGVQYKQNIASKDPVLTDG